jgi:hypothetical protein
MNLLLRLADLGFPGICERQASLEQMAFRLNDSAAPTNAELDSVSMHESRLVRPVGRSDDDDLYCTTFGIDHH